MNEITISTLVRQTGLTSSALRYYERMGLIRSIGRKGLQRVFSEQVLEQLALIELGKKAGFSIAEIKAMLGRPDSQVDKLKLEEKAQELEQKIRELESLRKMLNHATQCSFVNPLECPKFKRIMALSKAGSVLISKD
ncbi:helix-turn-helix domain-containing protein [uncultured Acinetobacter sp.]|uniref:helix-turn-helix domain-containing protein n=1 Tax=uncultured Acinetobacter sp. TaxID=165433 RepID=UPI00258D83AC|nr:helix-turn-helix domain-containing protein [uncultured Acinetobacter sp.]